MQKTLEERYLAAKRRLFEKAYSSLNEKQREAVFTTEGNLLVLAGAGDQPFGVGIMTNNVNVAQGDFIDVQYKNIGLVYTGGSFGVGAALSVDANACFVAQTSGNAVAAVALEASGGAGVYVKALLVTGHGVEAAAEAATIALSDLTDVDTTGKADGKVLKYNGTSSKWEPGTDATE